MNVLLVPQWDRKAEPAQMEGILFAVGRSAPPFSIYPSEDLATLSVRHAQFFEEDGQLFLVDLGSENGSTVNGRPMEDRPELLRNGDIVAFGTLEFKIDFTDQKRDKSLSKTEKISEDGDATEILRSAAQSQETEAISPTDDAQVSSGTETDPGTVGQSQLNEETVYRPARLGVNEIATQIHRADEEHAHEGSVSRAPRKKASGISLKWLVLIALPVLLVPIYLLFRPTPSSLGDAVPRAAVYTYKTALKLVRASIEQKETDQLPAQLLQMVRLSGGGSDLQSLLDEATRYRSMLHLQDMNQLSALARLRSSRPFNSAVFETEASERIDSNFGSSRTQSRLLQAEEAWRGGELVKAISELMQLSSESESDYLVTRLAHYTRVVEDYETLSSMSGISNYPQAALDFYLNLDPLEDQFFWKRLAGDFGNTGQREFLIASGKLENAAELWRSYETKGGITGAMRQQPGIGEAYRRRAQELNDIFHQLEALLELSSDGNNDKRPLFPALVRAELRWQRGLLKTLQSVVVDPELAQKLEFLTDPDPVEHHE